jgi:CheY-like chemotaxis protein
MGRAKRILITEDEDADVMLMQISLTDFALADECATVNNGQEALDYLYCRGAYRNRIRGNPELILLDLKLPKVSGLELLREIRADVQFSTVAVVIFSSSFDEKVKADALSSGANDFMTKPMNFDAFRRIIEWATSAYLIPR